MRLWRENNFALQVSIGLKDMRACPYRRCEFVSTPKIKNKDDSWIKWQIYIQRYILNIIYTSTNCGIEKQITQNYITEITKAHNINNIDSNAIKHGVVDIILITTSSEWTPYGIFWKFEKFSKIFCLLSKRLKIIRYGLKSPWNEGCSRNWWIE